MTDIVIVTDPLGQKLGQLPVSVSRTGKLQRTVDTARGTCTIPANHPKATDYYFRTGNYIFVYSSDPTIANFCGILWNSNPNGTELVDGNLVFQIRSTEWVMHTRLTDDVCTLTGTPGAKFIQIVQQALKIGYLPISTDYRNVNSTGYPTRIGDDILNKAYCYEAANDLANANDAYWWFNPVIDEQNRLLLEPYFKFRRSSTFPKKLVVGGDRANLALKKMCDFTEIANEIVGIGHFESWDSPLIYTERNQESISWYKQVYTDKIDRPEITTMAGLITAVQAELKRRAFSRLMIDGVVTSAPYPRIGDICQVQLNDTGSYITARRGSVVSMQLDSYTVNPQYPSFTGHFTEVIP